jgi:hypothetical protein
MKVTKQETCHWPWGSPLAEIWRRWTFYEGSRFWAAMIVSLLNHPAFEKCTKRHLPTYSWKIILFQIIQCYSMLWHPCRPWRSEWKELICPTCFRYFPWWVHAENPSQTTQIWVRSAPMPRSPERGRHRGGAHLAAWYGSYPAIWAFLREFSWSFFPLGCFMTPWSSSICPHGCFN